MKTLHFLWVEWGRLLRRPALLAVCVLSLLSPILGLTIYRPLFSANADTYATTMSGMYIANPALAGGLLGAFLFAALTVLELDRTRRHRVDLLVDAVISPLTAAIVRLLALMAAAVTVQAVVALVWLPFTMLAVGAVFSLKTYLLCYFVFMFGALPLAILFAAAAYQITARADLSIALFIAFAALSLTVWSGNWLLRWQNPSVFAVSDDFSNNRLFLTIVYMRLTWLLALLGVWIVSYLCVRRYGRGALGSLRVNLRRVYRPALAALLLFASGAAYARQPFFDHSAPYDENSAFYQMEADGAVACSERYADVRPNVRTGELFGTATYKLHNLSGQPCTAAFATDPGYAIDSVTANGAPAPFTMGELEEQNAKTFTVELPADADIELRIDYGGYPQDWNIVSETPGDPEISDTYMRLENWVLAPTPRGVGYAGEGPVPAIMDLTLPAGMQAVQFGDAKTERRSENADGTTTWRITDTGYNMIVYAGDYVTEQIEAAGLTIDLYIGRKHKEIMEQVGAKESIRQVIEYCTKKYGPLEFYADGRFKLIQTRVAGGGYAGRGASSMNELDFTAKNLKDTGKGGVAGEVVIHELVHQWWGLGNMFSEDDLWSSEGLTVYTTYRIAKELYGEAYAKSNYIDRWQTQADDYYKNFYVRHPEYLDALPEEFQLAITAGLTGTRRYAEMPLKILKAEQLVGGEQAMDKILYGLFRREIDYTNPYLTYQQFLDACGLTEGDLELG